METLSDPSSSQDETRDWSDLPGVALVIIAKQLDWHIYLSRLRGVCQSWRYYLPLSLFPTFACLEVPELEPNVPNQFLISRFYLISHLPSASDSDSDSNGGCKWLVRLGELGHNTLHIFNPLDMDEYVFASPPISGSINLFDCEIRELASVFSLKDYGPQADFITKKTVGGLISNSNDSAYPFFVLLGQLEKESAGKGLVMFKLGESQWIKIVETNALRIVDIAFHKSKFYALDLSNWRVGLIDPKHPLLAMEFILAPGILGDPMDGMSTFTFNGGLYFLWGSYLVPSKGSLYLVIEVEVHSEYKKLTLIVFVLKEDNKWENVESLGDQIFFIGYDVSFSVKSCSVNLPQWKPSSICLFTCPFPMIFDGYEDRPGDNMPEGAELLSSVTFAQYWRWIFEMNGEESKGVVPFGHMSNEVYTRLFFPPPAWVQWRCPSLDSAEVRLNGLKFR